MEISEAAIKREHFMPGLNLLSQAEREVLDLLAMGKSVKEVACILNKSVNTVRVQKTAIYEKLQVRNQAQAAVRYLYCQ
ncbi:response regulator transcription factor [Chitinimonas sp. PSY-7]|uniref:LuxR C-terminal-related transcriptional regulator n=1 Tax=Chitinimonas sp. PSY-7 TaxID=3459088 RepID=UPI00403FE795